MLVAAVVAVVVVAVAVAAVVVVDLPASDWTSSLDRPPGMQCD